MHFIEELAGRQKLLCPETGAPLQLRDGRVVSRSGRDFGAVAGPLNFLEGHRETLDAANVPATEVERLRAQLELPSTPEVAAQIARAIAATGMQFDKAHLSAEASILAERFRIPAFNVGGTSARPGGNGKAPGLASIFSRVLSRSAFRLEPISHSIGERLTAGQEVFRSVRVRNTGSQALRWKGLARATIKTRWSAAPGASWREKTLLKIKGAEFRRSNDIPVDIEPGREITLILRVRAPSVPGTHILNITLAVGGRQIAPPLLALPVEAVPCELPVFDYAYHPVLLEYGADHHIAMLEAAEFLEAQYGGRPVAMLEIGGGVHPTSHALALRGHRVVATDISHSQSILGTLYFRHKMPALDESLTFASCEGTRLPFADETFDGVVMFAAFHHFADPVGLLREIKRVSRPDGFVFLGCDTCAPDPVEPEYRKELRCGINEQMWTLAEFTGFFRAAGMRVVRARVDHSSLKVGAVWSARAP